MKQLTDEELNTAMCEWMGWKRIASGQWCRDVRDGVVWELDYLSDDSPRRLLNEAEARLTESQRLDYANNHLYKWIAGATEAESSCALAHSKVVCATARQRVIAILQTIKPELFQ